MLKSFLCLLITSFFITSPQFAVGEGFLVPYGGVIKDYKNNLIWSRCSVGQRWNGFSCSGRAAEFTYAVAKKIAEESTKNGGKSRMKWRIPSKNELKSIICYKCGDEFIDPRIFPNTPKVSYWTNSSNMFRWRFLWAVNFLNGQSFANTHRNAELALRLVSDEWN